MQKYEIDLAKFRNNQINESVLSWFGTTVKMILQSMFAGTSMDLTVRGTSAEIDSFAQTLAREKNYIESFRRHGLDDPITHSNKHKLQQAVRAFEKETNVKWPFV